MSRLIPGLEASPNTIMKSQHKLNSQESEQESAVLREISKETPMEFATPEELLRHDALHTPVPPAIAHRLGESVGPIAAPRRPWWRRWLGH
jgi:hypothetical protein